ARVTPRWLIPRKRPHAHSVAIQDSSGTSLFRRVSQTFGFTRERSRTKKFDLSRITADLLPEASGGLAEIYRDFASLIRGEDSGFAWDTDSSLSNSLSTNFRRWKTWLRNDWMSSRNSTRAASAGI